VVIGINLKKRSAEVIGGLGSSLLEHRRKIISKTGQRLDLIEGREGTAERTFPKTNTTKTKKKQHQHPTPPPKLRQKKARGERDHS